MPRRPDPRGPPDRPGPSASPSGAASTSPSPATVTPLKVGLGYIPSVQFAQFYYAQQQGYYRDAGLDVTFENAIDPDLIRKTGLGTVDISLADGTSLIPAVSQGIPVKYVATIYARFPNVVFADAARRDLHGRGPQGQEDRASRVATAPAGSCSRHCCPRPT